jgi:16S rRNA (uracil1498-N3)-methyltransferase
MSGFRPRFFVSTGAAPGGRADGAAVGTGGAAPDSGSGLAAGGGAGLTGTVVALDAEDSHHALRVLRLRPGDECEVVVGSAVYAATVLAGWPGKAASDKAVEVRLGERIEGLEAGATYQRLVVLVQALARPSALDWSIEKSIEAGASLILLVQSAGSPKPAGKGGGAREARWARIAREAAKQSKQPSVPPVEAMPSFAAALERLQTLAVVSLLLDPGSEDRLHHLVAAGAAAAPPGVAVWIGPESGWTEAERESLIRAGALPARLGRGVLRTETAGPVAVAVTRLALGDW